MKSSMNRWMVGIGLPLAGALQAHAEGGAGGPPGGGTGGDAQVGFAHQTYIEDNDRVLVNTETVRARLTLSPSFDIAVRGVYDAVSGATPTGAPAINQLRLRDPATHASVPTSSITGFTRAIDAVSGASSAKVAAPSLGQIPTAETHDIRRGGDVSVGWNLGPSRLVPQVGYSAESDYVSWSAGLTYSLELNSKNTIVSAGWSHSWDHVLANQYEYITERQSKNTDDLTLGVSQILDPRTVLSVTGTIGHTEGYLNDPYRGVVFQESPLTSTGEVVLAGENRPTTRDSQALLVSVNHAFPTLDAAIEGSYRFYHDSYGIFAHTVGVSWFQKIGPNIILSPSLRYYHQSAADFYGIQFDGDPGFAPAAVPTYYSSDYRLSALETFTLGLDLTFTLLEGCELRLGYHRYLMQGLDHQTLQEAYPDANIFTASLTYTF